MDVRVTGYAGQSALGMNALFKLLGLIAMATGTVDLVQFGIAGHVLLQVGTLEVATGTAVFAMGGGGKVVKADFAAVATKAVFRVVGHFVHCSVEYAWQHEQH